MAGRSAKMAKVTTLAPIWWPLMEGPSVETPYCCVCGARWPLNCHHVVKRSAATRTAEARGEA